MADKEIHDLINSYCEDRTPDYQMSSWLMAVLLNGMSLDETVSLTHAMLESGQRLSWDTDLPVVDKHSTGGIGDKVSIPLAPMLACCGVKVPMISGRGLGPTGGTLDKLESLPGYRTDLSESEIQSLVSNVGCVITGATREIAPADQKLYALRDVTGTVESIPLITASILSKKLAAGLDALVLDVKFGSGAFMKSHKRAIELARSLVTVGNQLGVSITALLTDQNQTLGNFSGNAAEVMESIQMLQGHGPEDLVFLTVELGAHLLSMVKNKDIEFHRKQLSETIYSGSAARKFWEMTAAQGADSFSYQSEIKKEIRSPRNGFLTAIDARKIGLAIIELGGGRKVIQDRLDHKVAVQQVARIGDPIGSGQTLFQIMSSGNITVEKLDEACRLLDNAFEIGNSPVPAPPLIRTVVTPEQMKEVGHAG